MVASFAEIEDVQRGYDGAIPQAAEGRVQSHLDALSARLRLLLTDLPARIEADTSGDLAITARDVVVRAVIRRMEGSAQQVRSESEGIGPFSRTLTYTTDKSGTFPDEDLALLGGASVETTSALGTAMLGHAYYGAASGSRAYDGRVRW